MKLAAAITILMLGAVAPLHRHADSDLVTSGGGTSAVFSSCGECTLTEL